MKLRITLPLAMAALLVQSSVVAQSPGIIYPTNPASLATGPSAAASTPAARRASAVPASAPGTSVATVGRSSVVPTAASGPIAAPAGSSPAVVSAVARLNAVSAQASASAASATQGLAPSSTASSARPPSATVAAPKVVRAAAKSSDAPERVEGQDGVTVRKLPDGRQVFRSTPNMAQAEAALVSQMGFPSIAPAGAAATGVSTVSVAPAQPAHSSLGDAVKPLPKWVAQNLDRTQGQTKLVVSPGVTEIVKIARNFPNRFVTPFQAAEVVTTDEALTHDGVGGSVIVATSSDKPIGIFIQDRDSDRAIALVLIPEDIPQRELRLVLDDTWGPPVLRNSSESAAAAAASALPSAQTDYVDYIKSVMRSMAKGDIPDGHAMSAIQPELVPACQIPGLSVRLGQMLEGSKDRVVVYLVTNESRSTVPVQESGCYRMGVLAAAAFPRPVLEPGQSTELFVLVRKDSADARSSGKRRPSLVN